MPNRHPQVVMTIAMPCPIFAEDRKQHEDESVEEFQARVAKMVPDIVDSADNTRLLQFSRYDLDMDIVKANEELADKPVSKILKSGDWYHFNEFMRDRMLQSLSRMFTPKDDDAQ